MWHYKETTDQKKDKTVRKGERQIHRHGETSHNPRGERQKGSRERERRKGRAFFRMTGRKKYKYKRKLFQMDLARFQRD